MINKYMINKYMTNEYMTNELLEEIELEEIDDECCIICQENITNEFGILNCQCKTLYFHNKCLNEWLTKCNKCPQCSKKFYNKPSNYYNKQSKKYSKPSNYNGNNQPNIFAMNYNILRILSGMSGLRYSS